MLAEHEAQPVARTRSHALAGRLAYEPIADWLRAEALRAGLAELDAVWLTEVARLLPELLSERPGLPPPGPITDGWQNKRFFEALARAFTVKRGRLLLVLDDLQWCDAETLDWLHYLLDVADRPLLVVGTVRSEEADDGHALQRLRHDLARQNKLTEIHLNPLTVDETLALAGQITAHEVNADLADRFYRDTGGNPLFIVESMRAAETAGDAVRQLDDPRSASHIMSTGGADETPLPIPPKVVAVIQSRLERLSLEAQTLTQVAATIGHGFDVELLAHAAGKDEEAVLNGLDELWQRRIIREYDGACYDFSHDRIRDVAYAMIGPVKRRLLHRQVARALERIYGADTDPVAEELAVHCQRAGAFKQAHGLFPDKPPMQPSAFTRMPRWSRICRRQSRPCKCCRLRRRTERWRSICGMTSAWPKYWCMTGAASRSARPGTGHTSWQCRPIALSCVAELCLRCGLFTGTRGNGAMVSSFPSLRYLWRKSQRIHI